MRVVEAFMASNSNLYNVKKY